MQVLAVESLALPVAADIRALSQYRAWVPMGGCAYLVSAHGVILQRWPPLLMPATIKRRPVPRALPAPCTCSCQRHYPRVIRLYSLMPGFWKLRVTVMGVPWQNVF